MIKTAPCPSGRINGSPARPGCQHQACEQIRGGCVLGRGCLHRTAQTDAERRQTGQQIDRRPQAGSSAEERDSHSTPRLLGRIFSAYHWNKPTWPFHFSSTPPSPHPRVGPAPLSQRSKTRLGDHPFHASVPWTLRFPCLAGPPCPPQALP